MVAHNHHSVGCVSFCPCDCAARECRAASCCARVVYFRPLWRWSNSSFAALRFLCGNLLPAFFMARASSSNALTMSSLIYSERRPRSRGITPLHSSLASSLVGVQGPADPLSLHHLATGDHVRLTLICRTSRGGFDKAHGSAAVCPSLAQSWHGTPTPASPTSFTINYYGGPFCCQLGG